MENEILTEHLLGHIDKSDIRAHGVAVVVGRPVARRFGSHAGTVAHEGVVDININRCTVALCLPVARHGDFVPSADVVVLLVKVRRPLVGVPAPVEGPLPIEAHDFLALLLPRRQLQRRMIR